MYTDTRTDVLTGLLDLSFFLPHNKPAYIDDDQAHVFSTSTSQANSFSISLEMHCCNTLLWGNARLYIINHALFTHRTIS